MPRSKTGRKRPPIDQENMRKAVESVVSKENPISLRETCVVYKVSLATLQRYVKAHKEAPATGRIPKYDIKRVFTIAEEKSLVEYIETVAKMQYGLTKKGVRELAYKFAQRNDKKYPEQWDNNKIAGIEWMRHFMYRHKKCLAVRKPEATSLSRATSFNRTNINLFFNNIDDVHNRFGIIPPDRIWNIDETGLSTVQKPPKVVASKKCRQVGGITSAERGQLVTMIAAINAIGNHVPPMLIFPRVHYKEFMIKGAPAGTIGGANSSGWSTEKLFFTYLQHFHSHVKSSIEERVLLFVDNHETHLSLEAVEFASRNGIIMITFPPHTSHRLQPLDVSVYGPFKGCYDEAVNSWHTNNPGKTFSIYDVAEALGRAYPRSFNNNNIVKGFLKTGIYPLDRGVFSEEDFLASYVTDRPDPALLNETTAPNIDIQLPNNNINNKESSVKTVVPQPSCSTEKESEENQHELQPLCSTEKLNTSSKLGQCVFISPEQVQPFPKAGPRIVRRKGRKPGATRIVTDTPEKEAIKKLKMKNKEKKGEKKVVRKVVNENLKKATRKVFESDSEDDVMLLKDESSDGSLRDFLDEEDNEYFDIEDTEISYDIDDFVVVKFASKTSVKHYVGKIISKEPDDEYKIEFYKRIKESNKFIKDSEEIFDVSGNDLVCKLPKPMLLDGTQRIIGRLWFKVDLSNYNLN